ncbi:decaprenyl-phosphate phosphoribosyltransferase [Candidatus Fermentibacteria bacterium]|nr:decaprenyl-phosphate phosphoribosyltransferase [Candidatus Fermentibacteria bacterium]
MSTLSALVESLRPRSWTKNLFIFAGVLFGRQWSPEAIGITALGALGFSLLAGSVYLVNDIADRARDAQHPDKRSRPLASGRLSPAAAWLSAFVLASGTLSAAWLSAPRFALVCSGYMLMQTAYSFRLKHVVILDSLVIAMGFVLRALAGVELAQDCGFAVEISPWLLLCTFFLAVFIAFSKRRSEVVTLGEAAGEHRAILRDYSPHLLDEMIGIATAASIMSFAVYTVSERTAEMVSPMLWTTIPFVVYGIFRYLFLVHRRGLGGSPDRILLSDRPLLFNILLWILSVMAVLRYFPAKGNA